MVEVELLMSQLNPSFEKAILHGLQSTLVIMLEEKRKSDEELERIGHGELEREVIDGSW